MGCVTQDDLPKGLFRLKDLTTIDLNNNKLTVSNAHIMASLPLFITA